MRDALALTGTLVLALCLPPLGMSLDAAKPPVKTVKKHKPEAQNAGQKTFTARDRLQVSNDLKGKT